MGKQERVLVTDEDLPSLGLDRRRVALRAYGGYLRLLCTVTGNEVVGVRRGRMERIPRTASPGEEVSEAGRTGLRGGPASSGRPLGLLSLFRWKAVPSLLNLESRTPPNQLLLRRKHQGPAGLSFFPVL